MSIGERIIELRKAAELSQGDLADAMEVTRQAVSKWENDQASPDTLRLIKLAEVLDTDIEYLATGRRLVYRRPPVVIKSQEIVEKPVYVDKIVEKRVEVPVIEYVEKPVMREVPVIKKIYRTRWRRSIPEYIAVAVCSLLLGFLIGYFL